MKSEILDEILKNTPLEIRLKVAIESFFLYRFGGSIFMPLDEEGRELPEALYANRKCVEEAKPLIEDVLDIIKEWREDGKP